MPPVGPQSSSCLANDRIFFDFLPKKNPREVHKKTKRSKHHSDVRIGPPLALLIIPFPSTIIEHSLLLCGMIIFHQMSHRLAAHSRQDSRRSNSLSQEALAALWRMSATLLGLSLLAKNPRSYSSSARHVWYWGQWGRIFQQRRRLSTEDSSMAQLLTTCKRMLLQQATLLR